MQFYLRQGGGLVGGDSIVLHLRLTLPRRFFLQFPPLCIHCRASLQVGLPHIVMDCFRSALGVSQVFFHHVDVVKILIQDFVGGQHRTDASIHM